MTFYIDGNCAPGTTRTTPTEMTAADYCPALLPAICAVQTMIVPFTVMT